MLPALLLAVRSAHKLANLGQQQQALQGFGAQKMVASDATL
jgi:hypothetical protein